MFADTSAPIAEGESYAEDGYNHKDGACKGFREVRIDMDACYATDEKREIRTFRIHIAQALPNLPMPLCADTEAQAVPDPQDKPRERGQSDRQ